MIHAQIKIDVSHVAADLSDFAKNATSEELNYFVAHHVSEQIREHIRTTFSAGNQNFWERVIDSIEFDADASGAEVSIWETGARLRYLGGEVFPGKNRNVCSVSFNLDLHRG